MRTGDLERLIKELGGEIIDVGRPVRTVKQAVPLLITGWYALYTYWNVVKRRALKKGLGTPGRVESGPRA